MADSSRLTNWRNWAFDEPGLAANQYLDFIEESRSWKAEEKIAFWEKGFEKGEHWDNDTLIHHFAKNLGSIYLQLDSVSSSLRFLNRALEHSYNPRTQSESYNLIGALHMNGRDYPAALEYYLQSLEAAEKLKDGTEVYAIGNISALYGEMENYQDAIAYLKQSIGYADKLEGAEKNYSLAYDYAFMARYFQGLNESDSAVSYLNLALERVESLEKSAETKFHNACFIGYATATELYLKQGKSKEAEFFLRKAEAYAHPFYVAAILEFDIQLALLKKDYPEVQQLLTRPELEQHRDNRLDVLKYTAEYHRAVGDHLALAATQEEILKETEARFEKEKVQFGAFAKGKYELLRQQEEIKALQLSQQIQALTIQKQRTSMLLVGLLGMLLFIVAILFWQRYRNRKQLSLLLQQEVEAKTQDLLTVNEELRTLNHIASHDIKEPIRNIGSYLGLIERRLPSEFASQPDIQDFFSHTNQSISQLYTLVEDSAKYLSLSADSQVEWKEINREEFTQHLLFSLQTYIQERNAQVKLAPFPEIRGDANMLWVIFKNLIENGLKFNHSAEPMVEIRYQSETDAHVFSFVDNGIGIASQYQTRILEPYQRLHQRGEFPGSGMGLSIVRLLVQKLGGKLSIQSEAGQGTTVRVSLPKHA